MAGVPSAVARRAEREAADLRGMGINPDSGAPVAVQTGEVPAPAPAGPVAAPAPSQPIAMSPAPTSDEVATLRARNAELEDALRTQNGRTSAHDTELKDLKTRFEVVNDNRVFLQQTVTDLTGKVDTLTQQLEQRSAQPPEDIAKITAALDGEGPTDQQKTEFGDSLDFVQRVVRQQLAAVIRPIVERLATLETVSARVKEIGDKLPRFERTAEVTEITSQRAREIEFLQKEVIPYFKDFETVRNEPEWKTYLAADTGRGYTNGDLLKTYRQTGDAVGIRTLLGKFYDSRKAAPSLNALAVPAKTGGDTIPQPAAAKMKASEYKQKLRDFTMKKLPKDQWDAYRTRFDEAIAANNVEMDVELR